MKMNTQPGIIDSSEPVEAATDMQLVHRYVHGDESAFAEIVHRYRLKILAVAQGLLHNQADAEEIAQDTFVRAHLNLSRFRGDSSLATWLHRIALNLARNRYWYFFRRRRHATVSLDCPIGSDGDATVADLLCADSPDPARESSRGEFAVLVADCLQKLDTEHRRVLTLRVLQELSYDEIAVELGINPGTVKSRIARARERLRSLLAESCPEFAPNAPTSDWFEPARAAGALSPA
jgi:RNA polymerase sigma-70 factor (ECF subfamily)